MTEIRQCWAYSKQGNRCEHPAGHNGDHVIQQTWTDEECAAPGTPAIPVTETSVTASQPVLVEKTIKCVACQHAHRNSACKCGCHEFIG